MTIDVNEAAVLINRNPDLQATPYTRGATVYVKVYGRQAGHITKRDIEEVARGGSPTGWGKYLTRGAVKVFDALKENDN